MKVQPDGASRSCMSEFQDPETLQAKDPHRKIPSDKNGNFQSGRSSREIPERKIPSESPSRPAQACRAFPGERSHNIASERSSRKIPSHKIQTEQSADWRSQLDLSKRTIPKGSNSKMPSERLKPKQQAKDPAIF